MNAQAADFAGLLAWRCGWFATFPRRRPFLIFKSVVPQWLANRSSSPPTYVGGIRLTVARRRRLLSWSRIWGPTNRLPEHEVCGEYGLRNSAAGL